MKQPEVELVLERADQLYKDSPPGQADKVSKSNCQLFFLHMFSSILQ